MAIRDILIYPDRRLRQVCEPVQSIDERVRGLLQDMADTMYQAPGIGLAAPQIGLTERLIVVDVNVMLPDPAAGPGLLKIVNPEIVDKAGLSTFEEGCLSLPGLLEIIERPAQVTVRYWNEEGQEKMLIAGGILATALQHEMDHINGLLILDYLSPLKRDRYKAQIKKESKNKKLAKDSD